MHDHTGSFLGCHSHKPKKQKETASTIRELTPYERQAIEETKEHYPHLRHRQIQGILQNQGFYLSFSSVYHHLKSMNLVEPYERRPSPLKEPPLPRMAEKSHVGL